MRLPIICKILNLKGLVMVISSQHNKQRTKIFRHGLATIEIVAIVLFLILFFMMYLENRNTPSSATYSSGKSDAWVIAKEFVKRNLKSPSTASFGGLGEQNFLTNITIEGSTYKVKGWVDSQNGFGAIVRSNFTVSIQRIGDKWKAVEGPVFRQW
jgi:hypothetical protein